MTDKWKTRVTHNYPTIATLNHIKSGIRGIHCTKAFHMVDLGNCHSICVLYHASKPGAVSADLLVKLCFVFLRALSFLQKVCSNSKKRQITYMILLMSLAPGWHRAADIISTLQRHIGGQNNPTISGVLRQSWQSRQRVLGNQEGLILPWHLLKQSATVMVPTVAPRLSL